jgi:hypothetical protein
MQVRKVAVVATGALATAAAMGSTPAFAADNQATPEVAPVTAGVFDSQSRFRASDEAMREVAEFWLTRTPEGWSQPGAQGAQQILSVGDDATVSALSWQFCGSSASAGVGVVVPVSSANTVAGSCSNGTGGPDGGSGGSSSALLSALDEPVIDALTWQVCGSTAVAGVGGAVPIASPNTVPSCDNNGGNGDDPPTPYTVDDLAAAAAGQPADGRVDGSADRSTDGRGPGRAGGPARDGGTDGPAADRAGEPAKDWQVAGPDAAPAGGYVLQAPAAADRAGYPDRAQPWGGQAGEADRAGAAPAGLAQPAALAAPWAQGSQQLLSVADGATVSALPWQFCGSTGVAGAGAAAPVSSPNMVMGDCTNGGMDIQGGGGNDDALISVLDGLGLSLAAWQVCGSTAPAGVGVAAPISSPNTVGGDCQNG